MVAAVVRADNAMPIPAETRGTEISTPNEPTSLHHVERLRVAAGIMARFDQLNAVEAHAVFSCEGRIVCVVERTGRTIFDRAEDFRSGGGLQSADEARALGLVGEAFADHVAARIGENLKRACGEAVVAQRFVPGTGPSMGALRAEMFGLTHERLWSMALEAAYGTRRAELLVGIVVFSGP